MSGLRGADHRRSGLAEAGRSIVRLTFRVRLDLGFQSFILPRRIFSRLVRSGRVGGIFIEIDGDLQLIADALAEAL